MKTASYRLFPADQTGSPHYRKSCTGALAGKTPTAEPCCCRYAQDRTLPSRPTPPQPGRVQLPKATLRATLLAALLSIFSVPVANAQTTTVDICNRTPQVRDAILAQLSSSDCASVPEADLGAITSLDTSDQNIMSLQAGDFAGLSGLTNLELGRNGFTSLPAGVFAGLSSLQTLRLGFNRLATLPGGVFGGLSNLQTLELGFNRLATLPGGVFDGLSSLATLRLDSNRLVSLPGGVFSNLSNLDHLGLRDNQLTTLPNGVFDGLSSLATLRLDSNQLVSLPGDVFVSLSSLATLRLDSNRFASLPGGVFDNLSSLVSLNLESNRLTTLSSGVFNLLPSLRTLFLRLNRFTPGTGLPRGIFDNALDTLGPVTQGGFAGLVVDDTVLAAHFVCSRPDSADILAATVGVDHCLRITSAQLDAFLGSQPVGVALEPDIAGDDIINIAERRMGFAISGTTEAGATVSVTVGSGTARAATVTDTSWTLPIPGDDTDISGMSLVVTVTATLSDRPDGSLSRTIAVDLVAPGATWSAPASLTVGAAIITINPGGPSSDIASYAVRSGTLPTGLSLNGSSGVISGTPSAASTATSTVTIRLTDTNGNTADVDIDFPAVARGEQTLSGFRYTPNRVRLGQSAPAVSVPPGVQTGSTLSYSASPASVCRVNAASGALTLVGEGSCSITVTATQTANYNVATATTTVTVTPAQPDPPPPGPGPDAGANAVGNLQATATTNTVTLSWDVPMQGTPTGYHITRTEGSGAPVALPIMLDGVATGFSDPGLTPDTRYIYSVAAIFSDGGLGPGVNVTITTRALGALDAGADAELAVGFVLTRDIIGGSEPLQAQSDAQDVVAVSLNDATLQVAGLGVGMATIIVTDATGATDTFAVSVTAAPALPETAGATSTGEPTTATFSGGVSTDGGASYAEAGRVRVGDEIEIVVTITPEAEHVGAEAYLLIVVQNPDTGALSAINSEDVLAPVTVEQLLRGEEALAEGVLSASEIINVLGGRFRVEPVYRGLEVNLYVGYSLQDAPEVIHYSPTPFPIAVD